MFCHDEDIFEDNDVNFPLTQQSTLEKKSTTENLESSNKIGEHFDENESLLEFLRIDEFEKHDSKSDQLEVEELEEKVKNLNLADLEVENFFEYPNTIVKPRSNISPDLFDEDKNNSIEKFTTSPDLFQDDEEKHVSPDLFDEHLNESKNQSKSPDLFEDEQESPSDYGNVCCTYSPSNENEVINSNQRKKEIITKIENLIIRILDDFVNKRPLQFSFRDTKNWSNLHFADNELSLKSIEDCTCKTIDFESSKTKQTFVIIMYLISEIYELLITSTSCTLRELYYRNREIIKSQRYINSAILDLCNLLEVAPWELGVFSSSKGLIAGPLLIMLPNGEVINCCSDSGGIILPTETTSVQLIETLAELILIVEKDTVYEKLMKQNIFKNLEKRIILITGKGYPDINTRIMVKKISTQFKLPIYILVDADPFGIDILLVYRFGSKAMAFQSDLLACKNIHWIGIYPSEIDAFAIPTIPLSDIDRKKIDDLLDRSYLPEIVRIELLQMKQLNRKAEIEGVFSLATNFLVSDYIPFKIRENVTKEF